MNDSKLMLLSNGSDVKQNISKAVPRLAKAERKRAGNLGADFAAGAPVVPVTRGQRFKTCKQRCNRLKRISKKGIIINKIFKTGIKPAGMYSCEIYGMANHHLKVFRILLHTTAYPNSNLLSWMQSFAAN